jgi:hypothetical protein
MTPTRSYVYEPLSREEAEWRWRDAARSAKLLRATRSLIDEGDKAPLCAALREDGLYDLAELVELARFPGRLDALDLKARVRLDLKLYGKRDRTGKLKYGERQNSIDILLRGFIEHGELSLVDKRAIVAWRKAQELCTRLEREAEADAGMSLEQFRQKIKPGLTALREAMYKDPGMQALRAKLVRKLNRDAARQATPAAHGRRHAAPRG